MALRQGRLTGLMALGLTICPMMAGCQNEPEERGPAPVTPEQAAENPLLAIEDTTRLTLNGETFTVALALDDETRFTGLGGVPDIPPDRGMLFLFDRDQQLGFVMRDCLVDIDIAYLTERGTVGRMYTMTVVPRLPGESDGEYERRLTRGRYNSGFPARMALELRAGTLERLGVSIGDRVEIEGFEELKERIE